MPQMDEQWRALRGRNEMFKGDPAMNVIELLQIIWKDRAAVCVSIVLCLSVGIGFTLFSPEKFVSSATVVLVSSKGPAGLSQFADLASVAGLDLGGGGPSSQAVAVLKSDSLLKELIDIENLLPILFASKWDEKTKHWSVAGDKAPDYRSGVQYLKKSIRTIIEDKKAGTITIKVEWRDRDQAALWCNEIVRITNSRMRREAIQQSSEMISYLEGELGANPNVAVQQSIARVIEAQLEKMAFAKANEQFALKVVDNAVPARVRSSLSPLLVFGLSFIAGLLFSIIYIVARNNLKDFIHQDININ